MTPKRRSTDTDTALMADACATFGLCTLLAELNREIALQREEMESYKPWQA